MQDLFTTTGTLGDMLYIPRTRRVPRDTVLELSAGRIVLHGNVKYVRGTAWVEEQGQGRTHPPQPASSHVVPLIGPQRDAAERSLNEGA